MDIVLVSLIEIAYAIANLALISTGLAMIFGLMRIVNLAHGEFIVLGGYSAIVGMQLGLNQWVSMFILAPLVTGLFGLLVERLVIRWLYGRMIDTMLATWGLSLLMSGALSLIFGNTTTGMANPFGAVSIGAYQIGGYSLFIIACALIILLVLGLVFRYTRAGLVIRGAMYSSEVAAGLGYQPERIYMLTFAVGSALSGLAGAILAPLTGLTPNSGGQFIAKAFITVISGGTSVISGTLSASTLFGVISKGVELVSTPVAGEIALLVAALIMLRLMPQGITGRFFKGGV